MSRQRFVLLLIAALAVISAALLLATRRNSTHEAQGAALFPTLAAELNSVTALRIDKAGSTPSTLEKTAGGWAVKERDGYPADVAKLRRLLTSLGDARIVEEKTADPARYAVIGVEDPTASGAGGSEVTVVMPGGTQAVIVGKSAGAGSFVRRPGEQRSFSVEPGISVEAEPQYWIDSRLLDVPVTKIQSMQFKPTSGPSYAIHRSAADGTFSLEGAPAGRKPLDADALAPAPTTFSNLTAEDVAAQGGIDFTQPSVTILTLADGTVITLTGAVAGPKHWLQVASSKDAALTARAQGRAFEIASYRYDAIFKPLEQLLVPQESATPAPRGKATPAPAHVPKTP